MENIFKIKLREYWTGVMTSFNEVMAGLNIDQVKHLFEDEEILIEILSVQIDLISRKPEFQSAKRSIRRFLRKQKIKIEKVLKSYYKLIILDFN